MSSTPTPLPPTVLARWQALTTDANPTTVLPDGCSDLILHIGADGHADWHVSPLADTAMAVPGHAGEFWRGYRLCPGTTVHSHALLLSAQALWQQARHKADTTSHLGHGNLGLGAALEAALLEAIDTHTRMDARVQETLQALAHARSVGAAARGLGVSERSMERITQRATGQPPRFWRGLARVRNAAQALGTQQPLAEIAADHGYADQSHFSRECQRWLGQTPAALRCSPQRLAAVAQAGYG